MFEFIETKRHTVESVYGRPEAEVLARIDSKHKAIEFRFAGDGDIFLSKTSLAPASTTHCVPFDGLPRLILRRKTVKRRVLTETGEVRQVVYGEYYDDGASVIRRGRPTPTSSAHPIYRETFVEVEL